MRTGYLSMTEAKLPPGFRFHPRDEELITDYLARRAAGDGCSAMVDVDLNKVEPWDLPGVAEAACVGGKEWYFYSARDRKYATGQRTNRATLSGYWKATGKDRHVADGRRGGRLVGMRKTLVFYQGRAPKGRKTDWVMHEFRMEDPATAATAGAGAAGGGGSSESQLKPAPSSSSSSCSSSKEDWVLCRVFYKTRGLSSSAKPSHGDDCYYDDERSSSPLPPLMDTYINFVQHQEPPLPQQQPQVAMQGYHERAPCFSNLLSSLPQQLLHQTHLLHPPLPSPMTVPGMGGGSGGHHPGINTFFNPFSCEKKDVRAMLDHLPERGGDRGRGGGLRVERTSAEGSSAESFLAETGEHSMWGTSNPFS